MNCEQWFSQWVNRRLGLQLSANQAKSLLTLVGEPPSGTSHLRAEAFWNDRVENILKWEKFVSQATNNESSFFREAPFYKLFEDILRQHILASKAPLTVLSAGCAAGQEIYSCAIIAHRILGPHFAKTVELYGVDVDKSALKKGRQGLYHRWDLRGLSDEQLARYIKPVDNDLFELNSIITQNVTLRRRNLMDPWPPALGSFFDIVLLRNVVVHFEKMARDSVIEKAKTLVKPGGILVFAATEIPNINEGHFIREEWNGFFYLRRPKIDESRAKENKKEKSLPDIAMVLRGKSRYRKKRSIRSAKAPEVKPIEVDILSEMKKAFSKFSLGCFDEAIDICTNCLKSCKSLSCEEEGTFLLIKGLAWKAQGEMEKGLHALQKGSFLLPLSWVGHFHMAELLLLSEKEGEAHEHFIKASRCLSLQQEPLLDKLFLEDFPARQMLFVCQERIARCTSRRAR